MNHPWVVRAIALLLVLIGLQAGAFRDLPTNDERHYGAADYTAAVRPEARKPHDVPLAGAAAQLSQAIVACRSELPARPMACRAERPVHLHPDPTGPPRA